MKKILCLMLVILMLLATLIGCKKNNNSNTDVSGAHDVTESETEVETDAYGQVVVKPEIDVDALDYGGATVYILTRGTHQYMREMGLDGIIAKADVIDDKIYARNKTVEADLNVQIVVTNGEKSWNSTGFGQFITNQTMAGSTAVDVVLNNMLAMNKISTMEYFADLNSPKLRYLNTKKPYWNQSYIDAAGAYGVLPTIVGDLSLSVYDRMLTIFVNNELLTETSYTKESLHQLVLDGKWTLEEETKLVREFGWLDSDNSNTKTNSDSFAKIATWTSEAIDPTSAAFNLFFMKKSANGDFELSYESQATKINDVFSDLQELWTEQGTYTGYKDTGGPLDHFCSGRALMLQDVIRRNPSTFSQILDVDFSYSILPLPKYEATQDNYQTFSQDMYSAIAVMDCIDDNRAERVSAVLELMCAKSYSEIRPFYIEDVLKIRYAEDATSVRLMNLVMDGLVFDPAWTQAANLMTGQGEDVIIYGIDIWRGNFYSDRPGSTPATTWARGMDGFKAKTNDLNAWFKQQSEAAE